MKELQRVIQFACVNKSLVSLVSIIMYLHIDDVVSVC